MFCFVENEIERAVIVIPSNCYNAELLNLHSFFANRVKEYLPDNVQHLHPPKIFYKLNNPISLRVCNYSKFIKYQLHSSSGNLGILSKLLSYND